MNQLAHAVHQRESSAKQWIVAPAHPDAPRLAEQLKTSRLIAQILLNRGIDTADAGYEFLRPTPKQLHPPQTLHDLPRAAARIAEAIAHKQKIVIYGDYDVDGITATSILWRAIRLLGGAAEYYIPHRLEEGYGLNSAAIEQLIQHGAQLLISVDCGISAMEAAAVAERASVDLIITDHHQPCRDAQGQVQLPKCHSVVHPQLGDYANRHLCGAGVAYKLAWGIGQACIGGAKVSDEFRQFLIDAAALAALGTVADVMPLLGENRALVHFGLGGLKQSPLLGIKALIASAGLDGQKLDSVHVGFALAPRLNACGRMGHAALAVKLFTEANEQEARQIADYLQGQNQERKKIEQAIFQQAAEQVETKQMAAEQFALVVSGEDWHPGVIGIVASRLVERFHRPTLVICRNDSACQGSGRSIEGFDLADALAGCHDLLLSHGGHAMAAGLKVHPDQLEAFTARFFACARQSIEPESLLPRLKLDAEAGFKELTLAAVQELSRLEPCGQGNPRPTLLCGNVTLVCPPRRVGAAGEHLQLQLMRDDVRIKAIAFRAARWIDLLSAGRPVDLAVQPQINVYNNHRSVELLVRDVRPAQ